MQRAYTTAPITAEQVDTAYLIVGRLAPLLGIECWRGYCDEILSGVGRSGRRQAIIVATNPLGYLQGLCVHSLARHPVQGAILDVSVFVVATAADELGVTAALLSALSSVAGRLDCATIRIRTEGSQRLRQHIDESGQNVSNHGIALMLDPRPLEEVPWAQSHGASLPVKT